MKQSGFYKLSQRYIYLINDLGGIYRDDKERPVYCCIQDKNSPQIYWAIPTSSISNRSPTQLDRIKRFCDLPDRDIRSCYYHIGHTNRPAIYKISNALPVTETFINSEYTSQGQHLVLRDKKLITEIERKLARILFDESRHPNKYEQHISSICSYLKGHITLHNLPTRGIIINGASGTGKTTLAGELAKRLGFPHLDLDNYYYPPQDEGGTYRFTELRPRDEVIEHLKNDLQKHPRFVMSGTIGNILWDFMNPMFDLAVLLFVPVEIRVERAKKRAFECYGERVLDGGDLYDTYQKFYKRMQGYETVYHSASRQRHEEWATALSCPVLRVDGTKTIVENVEWIAQQYLQM